jgi:amino acid transporter
MQNDVNTVERPTLEKSISFSSYLGVGLGAIIGIGWLVYAGQWIQDGGPLGAMLAFAICGLLLIPVGKCYAELTSALPVAGGEMAFTFRAFGSLVSFVTAWALALSYIAITPFETIAIGALLEAMNSALVTETLYSIGGYRVSWSTIIPGSLAGGFLIWLNIRGAKNSAQAQLWLIYAIAGCSLVFISTALANGDLANLSPAFSAATLSGGGSGWAIVPASIISVLVVAPYFMAGFDTIPQAAEESGVEMKPQQLGVAILACIILGAIFYVLIILAVGMSVSSEQLSEMLKQKDVMPTAEVFRVAFDTEWAAQLVLFTSLLGLISTLNGFYIASSRILFSLGRGGMIPSWFSKIHEKHRTPSNALLFVGAISLCGPFIGKSALVPIVSSGSLTFALALLMTCLSAIRLRKIAPDLERPYRASTGTLYAGASVSLLLVLLMTVPGSPGQLQSVEFSIVALWSVFGILCYWVRQSRKDMSHEERANMILGHLSGAGR